MISFRQALDVLGRLRRSTGQSYPNLEKEIGSLSQQAQVEFVRLLIDMEHERWKAERVPSATWRLTK